MSTQTTFALPAPAKLNLGLEILGKRSDGFHELSTIFISVDLFDTLEFAPSSTLGVECSVPELSGKRNLVQDALFSARRLANPRTGARVTLQKRIPLAAGLGGASSDAAGTLIGCQKLWNTTVENAQLVEAAAELGSDVPFFLQGGCAFGRGRGELLEPLAVPTETWFVLVSPYVTIQDKTATLFRDLRTADFSDGERIRQQVQALGTSGVLDTSLLVNAFARPLYERVPFLEGIAAAMKSAGASNVALTGAGPSHYSVEQDRGRAHAIAAHLREVLKASALVEVVGATSPRNPQTDFAGQRFTTGSPG